MKLVLLSALIVAALCQARVVETVPSWNPAWGNNWNGWNGNNGWNGWNNWNNWPLTETIVETAAPTWANNAWGNQWNPAWGNQWNPAWGNNWNPAWGNQWNNRWAAPVVAASGNTTAASNKK